MTINMNYVVSLILVKTNITKNCTHIPDHIKLIKQVNHSKCTHGFIVVKVLTQICCIDLPACRNTTTITHI